MVCQNLLHTNIMSLFGGEGNLIRRQIRMFPMNFKNGRRFRSSLRNQTGFTLVEVLVSTIILSLIIFIAVMSYSTFLDTWQKRQRLDSNLFDNFRKHQLLRQSFESIYDYFITDPENEINGVWYPYFKGGSDKIEFVTLSSVFRKGKPALACLSLKTDEESEISFLVYEEAFLDRTYLKYDSETPVYEKKINVYENLKEINIRYYGALEIKWNNTAETFQTIKAWQEEFVGKQRNAIPDIIEITITADSGDSRMIFPVKGNNAYKQGFFNEIK